MHIRDVVAENIGRAGMVTLPYPKSMAQAGDAEAHRGMGEMGIHNALGANVLTLDRDEWAIQPALSLASRPCTHSGFS